jgi:hypothetical protein
MAPTAAYHRRTAAPPSLQPPFVLPGAYVEATLLITDLYQVSRGKEHAALPACLLLRMPDCLLGWLCVSTCCHPHTAVVLPGASTAFDV